MADAKVYPPEGVFNIEIANIVQKYSYQTFLRI